MLYWSVLSGCREASSIWEAGDAFQVATRYADLASPLGRGEAWSDEVVWSFEVVESGLVPDSTDPVARFEVLRAALLTQKGELYKSYATKALADARPDLVERLIALANRMHAAAERCRAARASQLAHAALVVVRDMRGVYADEKRLRGMLAGQGACSIEEADPGVELARELGERRAESVGAQRRESDRALGGQCPRPARVCLCGDGLGIRPGDCDEGSPVRHLEQRHSLGAAGGGECGRDAVAHDFGAETQAHDPAC